MHLLKLTGLMAFIISLTACGGGSSSDPSNPNDMPLSRPDSSSLHVYEANTEYEDVIIDCALAEEIANSCLLATLPLLIEETATPSVDDIMQRVIVSDDWMGQRLREVLNTMPDEVLQLFSAVTSVVIDRDIRPSFYTALSSTIFIDPAFLWLTVAEKITISQAPDFRSGFDDELAFVSLSRNVIGNNHAWDYYPLDDMQERTINDVRLLFASLILHELAHANDFFPPTESPFLDQNQTAYEAVVSLNGDRISDELTSSDPLTSTLMFNLAEVMYLGETATNALKAVTAAEVGDAMEFDGAADDYGYSSQFEDVAMLFGEAMMKYLFDVDRDIAYTNRPGDNAFCEDYIVAWGVRRRIGDDNVKYRAQFVVESIYPGEDFSLFFQNLSYPEPMRLGDDWCENIFLP